MLRDQHATIIVYFDAVHDDMMNLWVERYRLAHERPIRTTPAEHYAESIALKRNILALESVMAWMMEISEQDEAGNWLIPRTTSA